MILPNVSPIGSERSRYDRKYIKHIYFCRDCIKNFESSYNPDKCSWCGSKNIVQIHKANVPEQTKIKIAKNHIYNRSIDFISKDHKGARAVEKLVTFLRRKISK